MINPSASGWIDKFFGTLKGRLAVYENSHAFYRAIRDTGFIYGHVVSFTRERIRDEGRFEEEQNGKSQSASFT